MTNSTACALAIRRLALLVLVATGAAAALASDLGIGPGPVLLRLKPHGSPLVYSSHETTIQVEPRRKGEPVVHRYEFDKTPPANDPGRSGRSARHQGGGARAQGAHGRPPSGRSGRAPGQTSSWASTCISCAIWGGIDCG